jgi:hypothetical protein
MSANWINLPQDWVQSWAVENTIIIFSFGGKGSMLFRNGGELFFH